MNDLAILVEKISKRYQLYDRPQDRLKQMLLWRFGRHYGREFWALRNISFSVRRGETVGIIGRNGSGKSTLLQIVAGTLAPTAGSVQVCGRVAALLELGSGFNPEFTGRENVYMNGAILGISREEMEQRFDEIVAFADIGEFIDQPVKLYSSGMMLRLAFGVQVVVEKDLLIVDEALSVGDEAFQRKCMRKLEDFQESGGTVLLVSHNAQTIVRQCERCLFLHNGALIMDGPSKPVTDIYQRFVYSTPQQQQELLALIREQALAPTAQVLDPVLAGAGDQAAPATYVMHRTEAAFDSGIPKTEELSYGGQQAEIFDCGMYDDMGCQVNVLVVGEVYTWRYRVRFDETVWDAKFGMMFKTVDGLEVAGINNVDDPYRHGEYEPGSVVEVSFRLRMNLGPGTYYLNSGVMGDTASGSSYLHRRVDICAVRVIPPDGQFIHGLAYVEPCLEVRFVR